ncbi:MAG: tRNA (adenosine(37)-N6)-threonylcarbamoyltransferase complex dimerization subunit type 1 TsaB [Ginsengibacter sp.]
MVNILNIHTATETAIINLMAGPEILGTLTNHETRRHASFLHTAIKVLLQQEGIDKKNLAAIGVTAGPGSYTGIRVGLATAMGLSYALKIPLLTFNTLEIIAGSAISLAKEPQALYCPMIDARRMEVYTAVYNYDMEEIITPSAIVLNDNSFPEIPASQKLFFSGSGSNKFQLISKYTHAIFLDQEISTESIAKIAWDTYLKNDFNNVPYAKPLYIK